MFLAELWDSLITLKPTDTFEQRLRKNFVGFGFFPCFFVSMAYIIYFIQQLSVGESSTNSSASSTSIVFAFISIGVRVISTVFLFLGFIWMRHQGVVSDIVVMVTIWVLLITSGLNLLTTVWFDHKTVLITTAYVAIAGRIPNIPALVAFLLPSILVSDWNDAHVCTDPHLRIALSDSTLIGPPPSLTLFGYNAATTGIVLAALYTSYLHVKESERRGVAQEAANAMTVQVLQYYKSYSTVEVGAVLAEYAEEEVVDPYLIELFLVMNANLEKYRAFLPNYLFQEEEDEEENIAQMQQQQQQQQQSTGDGNSSFDEEGNTGSTKTVAATVDGVEHSNKNRGGATEIVIDLSDSEDEDRISYTDVSSFDGTAASSLRHSLRSPTPRSNNSRTRTTSFSRESNGGGVADRKPSSNPLRTVGGAASTPTGANSVVRAAPLMNNLTSGLASGGSSPQNGPPASSGSKQPASIPSPGSVSTPFNPSAFCTNRVVTFGLLDINLGRLTALGCSEGAVNNSGGSTSKSILSFVINAIYRLAKETKASVHSMLGDTVQMTWNATSNASLAESKGALFLTRLRKMFNEESRRTQPKMEDRRSITQSTTKSTPNSSSTKSNASDIHSTNTVAAAAALWTGPVTVHSITSSTQQMATVVEADWFKGLFGLFDLAKKHHTLLMDERTARGATLVVDSHPVEKIIYQQEHHHHLSPPRSKSGSASTTPLAAVRPQLLEERAAVVSHSFLYNTPHSSSVLSDALHQQHLQRKQEREAGGGGGANTPTLPGLNVACTYVYEILAEKERNDDLEWMYQLDASEFTSTQSLKHQDLDEEEKKNKKEEGGDPSSSSSSSKAALLGKAASSYSPREIQMNCLKAMSRGDHGEVLRLLAVTATKEKPPAGGGGCRGTSVMLPRESFQLLLKATCQGKTSE